MDINYLIAQINNFVWGPIMLLLLVGTGIFLTIRLKFLPWRNLPYALKAVFSSRKMDESDKKEEGDITPFQSLMTALAATIGTGNIVGVATAMVSGGPGAVVWMWISALFGLSTKYAESTLAVKYRIVNNEGEMSGGPMYTLERGFKVKWLGKILAVLFSIFAIGASFGIGNMTQANSISTAIHSAFGIENWIIGIIIVILVGLVLLGGIKSIGKVCEFIVPFMAGIYVIAGVATIIANFHNVGPGIQQIFRMAFSFQAMAGGVGGTIIASAINAMRWGVARGVFSNESGLGSAPIAAAAAKTDFPPQQGYINMTGTFFDTLVICSITGLVIASSGALGTLDDTGQLLTGANLTIASFSSAFGRYGGLVVSLGLALFAFSTILGWEYYGEKSLGYLIDNKVAIYGYRIVFSLVTFIGATQALDIVWNISDTMNGLMAIPNLISLLVLSNVVAKECFNYQKVIEEDKARRKREKAEKKKK